MPQEGIGWICPVCGSGVAPSVREHCKKAKTPGTEIPSPSRPISPYPVPTNYCNLCNTTYRGWSHTCVRWLPNDPRNPFRITCSTSTGSNSVSSGPLPKDDLSQMSVLDVLREIENLWPACMCDKTKGEHCSNCPPDAGTLSYSKVPLKTM